MPQQARTRTRSTSVRCRLLHVNDTDADHEILTRVLKADRSFSVERARSGVEALEQLRNKVPLPNLVLVTWSFAQMACAEFIDQMKSEKRLAVIPIIVIASAISPEEVMQAYDAGAACVLLKEPDRKRLTQTLRSLQHFWSRVRLPFCDSPPEQMPDPRRQRGDTAQLSHLTSPRLRAIGKKAAAARWSKSKSQSKPAG
jgi:CheY-like chemotaxis protein